jgi:hypothetical protein
VLAALAWRIAMGHFSTLSKQNNNNNNNKLASTHLSIAPQNPNERCFI